jgi:hypothetical protein
MVPIIEPRAAKLFFIDLKPQWLNEPQLRADRHAAPPDVPRIRRNLRLIEHDVQKGLVFHARILA